MSKTVVNAAVNEATPAQPTGMLAALPLINAELSNFANEMSNMMDDVNRRKYMRLFQLGYEQALKDHKITVSVGEQVS